MHGPWVMWCSASVVGLPCKGLALALKSGERFFRRMGDPPAQRPMWVGSISASSSVGAGTGPGVMLEHGAVHIVLDTIVGGDVKALCIVHERKVVACVPGTAAAVVSMLHVGRRPESPTDDSQLQQTGKFMCGGGQATAEVALYESSNVL